MNEHDLCHLYSIQKVVIWGFFVIHYMVAKLILSVDLARKDTERL